MLNFIYFIFITAVIVFGVGHIGRLMLILINEGQILDLIFGWQKMLRKLYASENKWANYAEKILGGCTICFSHLIAFLCFWVYYLYCKVGLTCWLTDGIEQWWLIGLANFGWYILFVSCGISMTLWLTKPPKE